MSKLKHSKKENVRKNEQSLGVFRQYEKDGKKKYRRKYDKNFPILLKTARH
jgi:hypothetical protein